MIVVTAVSVWVYFGLTERITFLEHNLEMLTIEVEENDAMLWHFVLAPVTMFGFSYVGMPAPDLPVFDMDSLMTVLLGMLGLGGLRTVEKLKGKTN